MATLTTQVVSHAGSTATYTAAGASGDKAAPGAGVLLHVKNTDAASHTVTLATPGTVDGLAVADRAVTVPAAGEVFVPVLNLYRNPADGLASITYDTDVSATVTVAVVRVA